MRDALEIYEVARREVTISRSDGGEQKYAAVPYKQHEAGRPDLMVETLVLDTSKPYHDLFSPKTIAAARDRMDDYYRRHPEAKR